MNPTLQRQFDIIPENVLGEEITIIGAGAIGGWTALSLAKMGLLNLRVYDFDKVDEVNMNSQVYNLNDIGQTKTSSLKFLIRNHTGISIETRNEPWTGQIHPGIVIAAVDSMEVRKAIFDAYTNDRAFRRAKWIIDPRMGAESALLYVYQPGDKEACAVYAKSLYPDGQAVAEPCTAKATIYTANLLSGLVCKAVKDIIVGKPLGLKGAQWDIDNNELLCFRRKS